MQGYRVEEALHEGAKATLFRAVRTCDGRPITLKVLNPGHCRPEDRERLRRELDIGRSLAGAAVVEPLALSSADGLPALELLSDASALLSSTLDFGVLLDALARLCVRTFADWVVVDLLEGERSVRLAGAHRDPRKEPL